MPLSQRDTSKSTRNRAPKGLTESQRFDYFTRPATDGTDCILWTGPFSSTGYGMFKPAPPCGAMGAHRYAYRRAHGRESLVGLRLEVDHLCHRPACVNPAHLELVTRSENMRRQRRSQRPTCANGHPWTAETIQPRRNGGKQCRLCLREARQRYLDKVKADQPHDRRSYEPAVVAALHATGPARVATLRDHLAAAGVQVAPDVLRASLSQLLAKRPPVVVRIAPGMFALPQQIGGAA